MPPTTAAIDTGSSSAQPRAGGALQPLRHAGPGDQHEQRLEGQQDAVEGDEVGAHASTVTRSRRVVTRMRDVRRAVCRGKRCLPGVRGLAAVGSRRGAAVDDAGGGPGGPHQRDPPGRGPDRDRDRAALRDRPARAARPVRRAQPAVGVRHAARRRHRRGDRGPRRPLGDRDLAPALLLDDGRMGAPLLVPGVRARGRSRVGDARRRGDHVLVGRDVRPRERPDADPLRRALRGRHRPAPARRPADRRHRPGHPRSRLGLVHVQLPEPDPAAGNVGAGDRLRARVLRLRTHLRCLVGYRHSRRMAKAS